MLNPWYIDPLHITIRLLLALLLGGVIGMEREKSHHVAGFRTHILVCLGSSLVMLLSIYGFSEFVNQPHVSIDPARLAAQVITGIGFLGAGAILSNGRSVTGLTTAASLWVVAAIGLSVGAGFYYPAILTALLVLITLMILNRLEKVMFRSKRVYEIKILMLDQPSSLGAISFVLGAKKIEIEKVILEEDRRENEADAKRIFITFSVRLPRYDLLALVIDDIRRLNGVTEVSVK